MRRDIFGIRRLFGRGEPLLPRRGPLDDYGSPFGFGRNPTYGLLLLLAAVLAIGIFIGRHWNELF